MRKFIFLLILAASVQSNAQTYIHGWFSSPYVELTGATTLTSSTPWTYASAFNVPIGFTFDFRSTNFTSVNIEGSGFTYFDPNYYYLALPFTVKLQSKGSSGNNSPISYITTGVAPNRITKIQWKNAGFFYDTTSTINFQMWLYETDNFIEVHIGPNDVPNPSLVYQDNGSDGPVVGVYHFSSASNCTYSLSLSGAPSFPTGTTLTGNINIFANSLSGTPADGQVYRFEPYYVGVAEHSQSAGFASSIASDIVSFNSEKIVSCLLYSVNGNVCLERRVENQQVFVGDLPAGMYILEAQMEGVVSRQKLVISR